MESRPDVDIDNSFRMVWCRRESGTGRRRNSGCFVGAAFGNGGVAGGFEKEGDALAARDGLELGFGDAGCTHHGYGFAVADDDGAGAFGEAVGSGEAGGYVVSYG